MRGVGGTAKKWSTEDDEMLKVLGLIVAQIQLLALIKKGQAFGVRQLCILMSIAHKDPQDVLLRLAMGDGLGVVRLSISGQVFC